jgi:hypothetical protein
MARLSEKSIREIVDKRQRLSTPDVAASWRMSSLVQTFNEPAKHRGELLRYFPIAVVATVDGYFRARLAEIIDSGEPFLSNAVNAYPNVTLDISLAGAIAARTVTLGELLMNPISMSGFDSLIQVVTRITGVADFLGELAEIKPRHLDATEDARVIHDPASTWGHLGKVFALRHILCHELAKDLEIGENEIHGLLVSSQQFMVASAQWFDKLEHPHPPPSREERLKLARNSRARAENRLKNQLSVFNSEKSLSRDAKTAVLRAAKKLADYQKSVEDALAAIRPDTDFPSPYEEQNIRDNAEAINNLASRLKLSAMFFGIGDYRDLHTDGN